MKELSEKDFLEKAIRDVKYHTRVSASLGLLIMIMFITIVGIAITNFFIPFSHKNRENDPNKCNCKCYDSRNTNKKNNVPMEGTFIFKTK